jgi:hypothetical protein
MLTAMLFSEAVPVLDSVAANAAEVVPVSVLGNASDGVSEATGPVPGLVKPVATPKKVPGLLSLL